jgi:pyruvate/2-oxoglutarate dehydrogenase complex dihydrolipoamide acyltransferase (E2) component
MAVQVRVPVLGESVTEGTIVRWAKQDGEPVAVDDVLFELETDKANMEIPSEAAGKLKILKPAGSTVQVGDAVAEIDGAGAGAATTPAKPAAEPKASLKPSLPLPPNRRYRLHPSAPPRRRHHRDRPSVISSPKRVSTSPSSRAPASTAR